LTVVFRIHHSQERRPAGGNDSSPREADLRERHQRRKEKDMKDIQQFNFKGNQLRTLTDNQGEPWFVAKDVCDILNIDTNHLRDALDEDEITNLRNSEVWNQPGRAPLIISEPGLYKLIMRSRKPEAKEFQRWVTHEVLPQIRKTGGYIPTTDVDDDMTILAKAVMIGQRTMEEQKRRIASQESRIRELEPKALFADAVAASDGTCLVGELAKMLRQNGLDIGQNRLFRLLRDDGFLGKSGANTNVPTQKAMELGLFRIKETAVTHSDGHVTISRTPKVTGKGQRYFINRYGLKHDA
jgi:anti-repressor protein